MSVSPECLEAHLHQYRICGRKRPSADHCRGHWSGDAERRCRKTPALRSGRDLRGRARARARQGSPADRAVHESGTVPARKACGDSIRGDADLDTWHSDARKRGNGSRRLFRIQSPSAAKNCKNDLAAARSLALKQTFRALCRRESIFDYSRIWFWGRSRQPNTRLMCASVQVWHETDSAEELVSGAQSDVRQARDRDNDKNIRPALDHPPQERNFRICSCLIHRKPRLRENLDFGAASGKKPNTP